LVLKHLLNPQLPVVVGGTSPSQRPQLGTTSSGTTSSGTTSSGGGGGDADPRFGYV
jgi:hypothetical protein